MKTDSIIIKYLLSEGIDLKRTNMYVDEPIINNRSKKCEQLLEDSVSFRGYIYYYETPNCFFFITKDKKVIRIISDKSVHLPENKEAIILVHPVIEDSKTFQLLYYDRI